jgi:CBS domain-containing protein
MNVGDLAKRQPVSIRRHEDTISAARTMRDQHVGCLIVTEPMIEEGGERPIGVLTDRDLVTAVLARDVDARAVLVDDVMSREPLTVVATSSVETALARMREIGVRRVPVVDEMGRLKGVLSLDDVLDYFAEQLGSVTGSIRKEMRVEKALRP